MKMKIEDWKATGNNVLVRVIENRKTSSGIIMPETVQQGNTIQWVVVNKGANVSNEINEGDELALFAQTATMLDVEFEDGHKYCLVHDRNIHLVKPLNK